MLFLCADHTPLIKISSSGIGGFEEVLKIGSGQISGKQWEEISTENFDFPFIVYKKALTESYSG